MRPKSATVELSLAEARQFQGDVRLWLRLLSACGAIERELSARLRAKYGLSLARFDFLAQLDAAPGGLTMSELGARLMVTGGNVTGMTDRLLADELILRFTVPADRRVSKVRLTAPGQKIFSEMAADHRRWVGELLSGLEPREKVELFSLLEKARSIARERTPARAKSGLRHKFT